MKQEWLSGRESVRFFGRTIAEPSSGRTFFNWSGSGFEFQFEGVAAYALLYTADTRPANEIADDRRAFIGVYLDNGTEAVACFKLDEEERWYPLVENIPAGRHTVRVVKLTECGYARAAFLNIKTAGQSAAEPTIAAARRLEFIGDSITCGYGNMCSSQSPSFVTREENAAKTFAWMLGRMLGAEVNMICASGNGVAHDYGCQTKNLMPELYPHTDKYLTESREMNACLWDFTKFVPDLIIIKLGANDSRYCDGWDVPDAGDRTDALKRGRRDKFCKTLRGFLDKVTELNPGKPILYLTEDDTLLRDEIHRTVEDYRQGLANRHIYLHMLESKRPWEGVGANGHWSVATHQRAALVLEPVIREICGW